MIEIDGWQVYQGIDKVMSNQEEQQSTPEKIKLKMLTTISVFGMHAKMKFDFETIHKKRKDKKLTNLAKAH